MWVILADRHYQMAAGSRLARCPVENADPGNVQCPLAEARERIIALAFSSEVETGSREENASKQKLESVLIQSEPKRL
jgi:hypothetical protein